MPTPILAVHQILSRRYFLRLGAAGLAAWRVSPLVADDSVDFRRIVAELDATYLTPADEFGTVERGDPLPYTLPPEKLREVGLTRETWRLEVTADPNSDSQIERPMSRELGTAFDWPALMRLAETHAVRYFKVMTCNNGDSPLGMGLWEGVPLREIVWMTNPKENVRQLFYYGHHNDDPAQMFQCWLPINRVLEDPPGELPVLLCYKLNGEWLSGKRGGPVRMLVPEAYGFKSVKWLSHVLLTNNPMSNDTYASGNNDTHSWLKTMARFVSVPSKAPPMQPIPLTGVAQVGISGLAKVQYWLHPQNEPLPPDDPNFVRAGWVDAEILPWSDMWTAGTTAERSEPPLLQFDPMSERPREWPMRYTIVHWAALAAGMAPGRYDVRCRTIDLAGHAQPLPRPFGKSGRCGIQRMPMMVE